MAVWVPSFDIGVRNPLVCVEGTLGLSIEASGDEVVEIRTTGATPTNVKQTFL